MTGIAEEVVLASWLSTATAVRECAPAGASVQLKEYGAVVSEPSSVEPSKKSTRVTNPSESEAFAVSAIPAGSVNREPPTGDVSATAGGTFEPPGVGVGVEVGVAVGPGGVFVGVGVAVGPGGVGVAVGVGVDAPDVTETPSNVEVLVVLVMRLVTGRPTRTLEGMDTVPVPRTVHAAPSGEVEAVKVDPTRASLTQ